MFKLGKMVMQFQFVSQQLRFFLKTKCPYSQAHTFKTKTKNKKYQSNRTTKEDN